MRQGKKNEAQAQWRQTLLLAGVLSLGLALVSLLVPRLWPSLVNDPSDGAPAAIDPEWRWEEGSSLDSPDGLRTLSLGKKKLCILTHVGPSIGGDSFCRLERDHGTWILLASYASCRADCLAEEPDSTEAAADSGQNAEGG